MQESSIITSPYDQNVPSELETYVFLMILQLLISYFAPVIPNTIQVSEVALLSTIEVYDNDQVTELESL